MRATQRLRRWLARSRPPARQLTLAFVTATVASVTGAGLVIGALALLVDSATRPGWRAVAVALVLIELVAFLRSPLRFAERMTTHRLGFSAVTTWRRWLVINVGSWPLSRWRQYEAGDLLERALRDTDELQDLWLRGAVPLVATSATLVLADGAVALVHPGLRWTLVATGLVALQFVGGLVLLRNLAPLVDEDDAVRRCRSTLVAELAALSGVGPDLALLGAGGLVSRRLNEARGQLERAEMVRQRHRRRLALVPAVAGVGALLVLVVAHPGGSGVTMVAGALLSLLTFDGLESGRLILDTAVAVAAGASRLDELEHASSLATRHVTGPLTLGWEALHLAVGDGGLNAGSGSIAPGVRVAVTGPSGSGKSTLLAVLAGLDQPTGGLVTLNGERLEELSPASWRARLRYVPAEPGLTRGLIRDVLGMGRPLHERDLGNLAALGLHRNRDERFDELSRGERQRVAVARALVGSPSVVILDEPTSGLGSDDTQRVLDVLATSDATIVIATHDPQVVAWCTRVLTLDDDGISSFSR